MVTSREGYDRSDTVDVVRSGNRDSAPVPRTDLHVRAWSGTDGQASEYGLLIPLGSVCPKVYMHDSDVCADGERISETVLMRKNHCVVTLRMEGGIRLPSGVKVKGNVAGYDEKGLPLPGRYEVLLDEALEDGAYVFILPRQTDASLVMEVDGGKDGFKAFALGHYIVTSGYDWNAPDLDDVTVVMDYALTEISLMISGWEEVHRYEIEI